MHPPSLPHSLRAGAGDEHDRKVLEDTLREAYRLFAETQRGTLKPGWFFRTPAGTWTRAGTPNRSDTPPSSPLEGEAGMGVIDVGLASDRIAAVPIPIPTPSLSSVTPNPPNPTPSPPDAGAPSSPEKNPPPPEPDPHPWRSDTAARLVELGDQFLKARKFDDAESAYIRGLHALLRLALLSYKPVNVNVPVNVPEERGSCTGTFTFTFTSIESV